MLANRCLFVGLEESNATVSSVITLPRPAAGRPHFCAALIRNGFPPGTLTSHFYHLPPYLCRRKRYARQPEPCMNLHEQSCDILCSLSPSTTRAPSNPYSIVHATCTPTLPSHDQVAISSFVSLSIAYLDQRRRHDINRSPHRSHRRDLRHHLTLVLRRQASVGGCHRCLQQEMCRGTTQARI